MRILSIETSCDETAIAIVEATGDDKNATFKILGNALLSQAALHQPYGGVYPTLAKREHIKNLPLMLEAALGEAKMSVGEVDVIAVTAGPGLEPALWTGIEFAKKLAEENSKPLVAVNHMEGHVIAALASGNHAAPRKGVRGEIAALARKENESLIIKEVEMPILALLISGGHTELVLMKEWLQYEMIGQTLDDAVGEAFDKVARMLGLPYPGGPEISKLAEQMRRSMTSPEDGLPQERRRRGVSEVFEHENERIRPQGDVMLRLPRPMINSNTCDFSFAGLKTAVLYTLKKLNEHNNGRPSLIVSLTDETKMQIAHEFENAVTEVLWKKTAMALEKTGAKTLVIGGGVSANTHIRRVFTKNVAEYGDVTLRIPAAALTTDNAIMIALAGFYRASRGEFSTNIRASGNLSLT